MPAIPARQVHLDFHTSEHIPDVGSRFDKGQFQAALRLGRVNWINIFAKCHHGWSYYPTRVGEVHPSLGFDLLGAQIEACHEIGVRAPIYYTVGWSVHDAETHPEWCVRRQDGSITALHWDEAARPEDRRPGTSWQFMCPSGGYLDLILAQTAEICETYPVDGLWYDITNGPICYCETCRRGMADRGIDLADTGAVMAYNVEKWRHFMAECNRVLHGRHPQASVFYNGTTVLYSQPTARDTRSRMWEFNTQQELEDLPTTWGGYDKLPLRAKFFHQTGRPLVAMSGKFHTSWGEFGGFKHPDALRYEAASMVAFGAACNFGDQLHPAGEMDMATYRNIGEAFAYVEEIEGYGVGAQPAASLGLWRTGDQADDEGVASMLLETQTDFLVVDPEGSLDAFEAIVLTGAPGLDPEYARRLHEYVQKGGRLLVLGESLLGSDGERFVLDVGARYLGPAEFDEDYTVVGEALGTGLVDSAFFNYRAAIRVEALPGSEVLARIHEPYFDRTYGQFCSHLNTPYRLEQAPHPAALRAGSVLLLTHRLGRLYHEHGARVHRDLFTNALHQVHRRPLATADLPSAGRISLLHQPDMRRYVLHLLYAPALQRGRCLVIEDLVPLYDVHVSVRLPHEVAGVFLVPGDDDLAWTLDEDVIKATVPCVRGHQAVAFTY